VIIGCVVLAMVAAGGVLRPRPRPQRRVTALLGRAATEPNPSSRPAWRSGSAVRVAAAAVAFVAAVVVIGGVVGIGLGLGAAAVVATIRPSPSAAGVVPDDVPVVVDLIAGCLAAGATMSQALDAAAMAADGQLRAACIRVATALRAGSPPDEAWQLWLADPRLAPVARTVLRTAETGAAAAAELLRTSSRLRAVRRSVTQHRVRQAAVWLVVPLGLCFLPAFVLVAVIPIVIGLVPSLR
jgi:pilus assembly protein TadC